MKNLVTETPPILPVIPLDIDRDPVTRSSRVDPTEAGGPPPARRAPMYGRMLWRVTSLVAVVLALSGQGLAQSAAPTELRGRIHDYLLTNDERWHVSGEWSLQLKGDSRGDFSAALIGVPRDNPPRFPVSVAHTHHVSIVEGVVAITENANGNSILTISGPGTFAGNGNLQSAFSGSRVQVTIKGGNAISYSNFEMIIGPPASTSHYGTETFHGVVTQAPGPRRRR
ncbi:MAG TPA: hypothetical protein VNM92_18605 [Thermoanaerobaculia bacterium]|nr:hypothetical protein [Thermoanaerobaculia bacterium]